MIAKVMQDTVIWIRLKIKRYLMKEKIHLVNR